MKIIDIKQNTPEWKELRRLRIGASDAAAIMGESPWETPYQWWERKVMDLEIKDNEHMKRGRELEPTALICLNEHYGDLHNPEWTIKHWLGWHPCVAVHDEYDWMMASFDGWNGETHVEIKCPGINTHLMALEGHIPDYYIAQLQHQMLVSNTNICYYFSFDGKKGKRLECKKDHEYCERLLTTEQDMYRRIIDFDPPPLTHKDIVSKDADPEWRVVADSFKSAKAKAEQAEAELKIYRDLLIEMAGKNSCAGSGIRVSKMYVKGGVDYTAIPELKAIDLNQYRKPTRESWRVS